MIKKAVDDRREGWDRSLHFRALGDALHCNFKMVVILAYYLTTRRYNMAPGLELEGLTKRSLG